MAQDTEPSNKTLKYAENIGLIAVPLSVAKMVVMLCAYDRHVPLLISESAVGKTAVLKQIARANNMGFSFYALAHREASDITGPMMPSSDGVTYQHLPPKDIPLMGLANQDDFHMQDLAEVNRAEQATLNGVFPIWTDRKLGSHTLGPNVIVVADMNPPDGDYAVTSSFSSDPAMRRRTCQIVINFSSVEFLRWAKNPKAAEAIPLPLIRDVLLPPEATMHRPLHDAVIEFIQANVDLSLDRERRDAGKVYGCPATWEACSDTLYTIERLKLQTGDPRISVAVQTKLAGHVGHHSAVMLWDYYNNSAASLDPRDMLLHFADKGNKSYRRVKRLLKDGEAARVAGALENMAIVWAEGVVDGQFTSEDVSDNLALIFNTVPLEVGGTLLDAITGADEIAGGAGGPTQRSTSLVRILHKIPAFKQFRDRRAASLREGAKKQREARNQQRDADAGKTSSQ